MFAAKNILFVTYVYCKEDCKLWKLTKEKYDTHEKVIVPLQEFTVEITPIINTYDYNRESQKGLCFTHELGGMLKNEYRYIKCFKKEHSLFLKQIKEYTKPFECTSIPRKTKLGTWKKL